MSWSCLKSAGSTLIDLVYCVVKGREVYHGPVVEKVIVVVENLKALDGLDTIKNLLARFWMSRTNFL